METKNFSQVPADKGKHPDESTVKKKARKIPFLKSQVLQKSAHSSKKIPDIPQPPQEFQYVYPSISDAANPVSEWISRKKKQKMNSESDQHTQAAEPPKNKTYADAIKIYLKQREFKINFSSALMNIDIIEQFGKIAGHESLYQLRQVNNLFHGALNKIYLDKLNKGIQIELHEKCDEIFKVTTIRTDENHKQHIRNIGGPINWEHEIAHIFRSLMLKDIWASSGNWDEYVDDNENIFTLSTIKNLITDISQNIKFLDIYFPKDASSRIEMPQFLSQFPKITKLNVYAESVTMNQQDGFKILYESIYRFTPYTTININFTNSGTGSEFETFIKDKLGFNASKITVSPRARPPIVLPDYRPPIVGGDFHGISDSDSDSEHSGDDFRAEDASDVDNHVKSESDSDREDFCYEDDNMSHHFVNEGDSSSDEF